MAISFRAKFGDVNTSANNIVLTKPTGTVENDILLAICSASIDATGNWVDPSGWVEIDEVAELVGRDRRLYVGYKIATGSEPSDYTFQAGVTTAVAGLIITLTGQDLSTPFDEEYANGSHYQATENEENAAAQDVITETNNAWVVLFQHVTHDDLTAQDPPSGYTELAATGIGLSNRQLYICRKEVSIGTEDPGVFTHAENGTGTNESSSFTLAIKPASSGINSGVLRRRR